MIPRDFQQLFRVALVNLAFVVLFAFVDSATADGDRPALTLSLELDTAWPSTDLRSWLNDGAGKLRYDEHDSSVSVGRVLLEGNFHVKPTLIVHVVGDFVDDGDRGGDLTEAFLEWRPVPRSETRHAFKVGAFYPDISLENRDRGWTSAYTISPSAINTWIGEEIRTIGAEWSIIHSLGEEPSAQRIKVFAAAFGGNDPAGTLLAWRGWSLHDRQTRLHDQLPLVPLPQIGPGAMFEKQALRVEPFIETDGRVGYYLGGEWRAAGRALFSALHYDNRADPMSLENGQYGWTTRFNHVSTQIELPAALGLIGQWIRGTTSMGPVVAGARVVDTSFDAWFLLLTRSIGRHRVSMRFDDFDVTDRDAMLLDPNREDGNAWTLAYSYAASERLNIKLEWLTVETDRPAWVSLGLSPHTHERLLQLQLAARLSN